VHPQAGVDGGQAGHPGRGDQRSGLVGLHVRPAGVPWAGRERARIIP
jgi:hypothetical protein